MDQPQIQSLLEELVGEGYHVYFQPPATVKMEYPAIVYNRDIAETKFADNLPYRHDKRYSVTLISRNPLEDEIYDKLAHLPMSTYERFFTAGNLNHDVFNIYF
jgi:hypothetical protein